MDVYMIDTGGPIEPEPLEDVVQRDLWRTLHGPTREAAERLARSMGISVTELVSLLIALHEEDLES